MNYVVNKIEMGDGLACGWRVWYDIRGVWLKSLSIVDAEVKLISADCVDRQFRI